MEEKRYYIFDNDENRFCYETYLTQESASGVAEALKRHAGPCGSFSVYHLLEGEEPPI